LPNEFVLKSVFGAGGSQVLCVKDKKKLNKEEFMRIAKKYSENVYPIPVEYSKEKLLIEELLSDNNNYTSMPDYKFFCSFGKVAFASFETGSGTARAADKKISFYYAESWKKIPLLLRRQSVDFDSRPRQLNKMIELSKILSKNLPLIRVDLYECNNKVYFGELTLYSGHALSIFKPTIWDYKLGKMVGKVVSIEKLNNMIDNNNANVVE